MSSNILNILLLLACGAYLPTSEAQCQMTGVGNWVIPIQLNVIDTHSGEFFRASTTNILSISSASHSGDALNRGPYFLASLVDSEFVLALNDNFLEYEEYETSQTMSIMVAFACTGGNNNLVFLVDIEDTNNHSPRFLPSDQYTFSITPPIAPGYELTGCLGDIVARDVDLTTYSIIFGIESNPYFELVYGGISATDSKNYYAILRATTFIRSLEEPLLLQISAQDVDLTENPARTTQASLRIEADGQFELPAEPVFSAPFYTGSYSPLHVLTLDQTITLQQGFDDQVQFTIESEFENYFVLSSIGNSITIQVLTPLPSAVIQNNINLLLVIRAVREYTSGGTATLIIDMPEVAPLQFAQIQYEGVITDGVLNAPALVLVQGYEEAITASVLGEYQNYFTATLVQNTVTLTMSPLSTQIIEENSYISIQVQVSSETSSAVAVVTLEIMKDDTITPVFENPIYSGSYNTSGLFLDPIVLIQGYDETVVFTKEGDSGEYFTIIQNGNTILLEPNIPPEVLDLEEYLIFSVRASKPRTVGADTTVLIGLPRAVTLQFSQNLYEGAITDGILNGPLLEIVEGFEQGLIVTIVGEYQSYFTPVQTQNIVTLAMSPLSAQIIEENSFISLEVQATSTTSSTVAVVTLEIIKDDVITPVFENSFYSGSYDLTSGLVLDPIVLIRGYDETVQFSIDGVSDAYFDIIQSGNTIALVLVSNTLPEIWEGQQNILFTVRASKPRTVGANTAVFINLPGELQNVNETSFDKALYQGLYELGVIQHETIFISGYEGERIQIFGEYAELFEGVAVDGRVTVSTAAGAALPPDVTHVALQLQAGTAGAALVLTVLHSETPVENAVSFDKTLYQGVYEFGVTEHETITITGYTGETIELFGDNAELFEGAVADGRVTVSTAAGAILPPDVTHIALQLQAGTAGAALVLTVLQTDEVSPVLPSVTFTPDAYVARVDAAHVGLVARLTAAADNGETLVYALLLDDAHLLERLTVSRDGELHLSAPASPSVYQFQVSATTVATQITASATVQLTVDSVTVCGEEGLVVPPLIILDRDEMEPYDDLVVLNEDLQARCWYNITNRWPIDQDWLYVNQRGLSTRAINREHESIAFMALSQVQVELVLTCEDDEIATRSSIGRDTSRLIQPNTLGPYDYGTSRWVLTDPIPFNSRSTLVNIIVNDINDNYPIFVDKEREPIVVGYPIPEVLELVSPRALAVVQATDADIGENALLAYWSDAPQLVVGRSSGSVHVRDNAAQELTDGATLTVSATDRDGAGLTGSIDLMVRLLDMQHIAVVTVRDSLLDDEESILEQISSALGYVVKTIQATVISDQYDVDVRELYSELSDNSKLRSKRQTASAQGASLQLYIYGLVATQPVSADQLVSDIDVNLASVSFVAVGTVLEDHIGEELCNPGSNTGLLVSTIVLAVLLFIVLVLLLVWYLLKRRKETIYEQFSDNNSEVSRAESLKPEILTRPRPNIEEIKRSERRMQDLLNEPVEGGSENRTKLKIESEIPVTTNNNASNIIESPFTDKTLTLPIVIQSIDKLKDAEDESDDEDEFGEKLKKQRRKSVVTFNEHVEKIIHVEDRPDEDDNEMDIEFAKL